MLTDIRFALRGLRKNLTFTLAVVLTLALATGALTAMFAIVEGVLIRPLPYSEPDKLVRFGTSGDAHISALNFSDWLSQSKTLQSGALHRRWRPTLTTGIEAERLTGQSVSANLFDVLGIQPVLGRVFRPEEERDGASPVVIVSQSFWQRRLGGNPNVIGTSINLTGVPHEVVGVMPRAFYFPDEEAELWSAQVLDQHLRVERGNMSLQAVARLRPGASIEQAKAEGKVIAGQLEKQYPKSNAGMKIHFESLHDDLVGSTRRPLLVLLAAVGALLLLACANIANLMLARAMGRQSEFAIRAAMGAGRRRLARQLLTESLVLACAGGALGLFFASWALELLPMIADFLPRLGEVHLSPSVAGFALLATGMTGILFGLAPVLHLSRSDIQLFSAAKAGTTSTGASGASRKALVVAQTALAVGLLCAAGLLIHSLVRLMRVPTGFDPSRVMSAQLSLNAKRYDSAAETIAFYRALVERLEGYPHVRHAGLVYGLPLGDQTGNADFTIIGDPPVDPANTPNTLFHAADVGYKSALGLQVIRGRWFDHTDAETSEHVAVINESLAKTFFGGRDPIGIRVKPHWSLDKGQEPVRIVGIVGDVKYSGLADEPTPELFQPFSQFPIGAAHVVVRTEGDPSAAAAAIKTTVRELDPNVPVAKMMTMEQIVSGSVADARFRTMLLTTFAGLALLIAIIGIYGVMSHGVALRRREIGIRVALGAAAHDILRLFISEGARLIVAGVVLGLIMGMIASRAMQTLLFGIRPTDPLALAASALVLAVVGLLAVVIPARRALRIEPIEVLRHE